VVTQTEGQRACNRPEHRGKNEFLADSPYWHCSKKLYSQGRAKEAEKEARNRRYPHVPRLPVLEQCQPARTCATRPPLSTPDCVLV